MKCEACHRPMPDVATVCKCGHDNSKPVGYIHCADEHCPVSASVNVRGKNYCWKHYEKLGWQDARDFCREKGLTTREQMRDFCLAGIKNMKVIA